MSSRRTSNMWYHFEQKEAKRAQCKYCNALVSTAAGSLGNLSRHLKNKHPTVPIERSNESAHERTLSGSALTWSRSRSPSTSKSTVSTLLDDSVSNVLTPAPQSKASGSKISQTSLNEYVVKPLTLAKNKAIDAQLLRMICKEYHPFSLVEDEEFKKFVSMLCPGYKLPSRKTLSEGLLPQIYEKLVIDVKKQLSQSVAVAITTDGWTSINNQSFIGITAHYINSNSGLCSSLLGCLEFNEKHSSVNLATMLRKECVEWDIHTKLVAIVTDNAPNIVAAASNVSKHIACYAHKLNLIVKSGISPIIELIEKCKIIVQYFKKSSHALAKLHESQKQMNLPELKLIQDVPTRWNSTFEMLKRLFLNKDPVLSTLALMQNNEIILCSEDWENIENLINILEVFDEVTKELSSDKSVTLSKTMVLSRNLFEFIKETAVTLNNLPKLKEVCEKLLYEINEKLISREEDLILEAAVLDPRFKKSVFKNSKKFDAVYNHLVGKIQSAISSEESRTPSCPQLQISSGPEGKKTSQIGSKLREKFDKQTVALTARHDPKAASIVEFDKYLAEPLLPRIDDPLIWWGQRKLIYPHVYDLAIKRLCIPASSVPCERLFSKAGQVLTEKRNRIKSNKLSKILFIQSNSK